MICSFRFYGALNDFLPAARRGRAFAHAVRHTASIKDVIEAIGVPHPEVELIVVNGAPQDFQYRVRNGDRAAVYPPFRSIALGDLPRVGTPPPEPVRFVVDEGLGRLASLLRLAGFDAAGAADDLAIVEAATPEGRVVLTRDVALLKRNGIRWGYWVRSMLPVRQLAEVLARFDLAGRARPFSRCLRCNVPVVPVGAEAVATRLLPRTRAEFSRFHECPSCGRVYWEGSHYQQLRRLLDTLTGTRFP